VLWRGRKSPLRQLDREAVAHAPVRVRGGVGVAFDAEEETHGVGGAGGGGLAAGGAVGGAGLVVGPGLDVGFVEPGGGGAEGDGVDVAVLWGLGLALHEV
jgi:hypothetical protein